jgi:hypothetical protein
MEGAIRITILVSENEFDEKIAVGWFAANISEERNTLIDHTWNFSSDRQAGYLVTPS